MQGFSTDIAKFCDKYKVDMKVAVRKIAFEAFKRVILKTPVDTGRARANWGVAVGQPNMVMKVTEGDKTGTITLTKAKDGVWSWLCQGSIFLTNNLPYIGVLEYGGYPNPPKVGTIMKGKKFGEIRSVNGFSRQAPNGMVRVTVEEMRAWVQGAIK